MTERIREAQYYKLPITEWPESDRPRERLMQLGAEKLSNAELLAILLRTGSGKGSALDLARKILADFGGLHKLASLAYTDLLSYPGIGEAKAVTILAALQLARRLIADQDGEKEIIFRSSEDVYLYFSPGMVDLRKEIFKVALLESNNRLMKEVIVSEGNLNSSIVHPREVFKQPLQLLAASVILIHNHPSGNLEPSREDIALTNQLVEAGKILGIPVLDHIVISRKGYTSFADRGLISSRKGNL